jgi:membrane protein YdbS with pleckstrin-like domain
VAMADVFISKTDHDKQQPKSHPQVPQHVHKPPFDKVREELAFKEGLPMYEKRPMAAFLFHPDGIGFETKESEEKVILFLRQHPVVNVPWLLLSAVMVFAPSFASMFIEVGTIPANFTFIFILMWYLMVVAFSLEKFLTWFFNVYIVTDERIIDIDFYNLIYKEVSDANIDKIQDVTYNMGGVVRTIFNYGNVLIQTASEVPNFEFVAVPKPDKVARILQSLRIEEQQEQLEGRVR